MPEPSTCGSVPGTSASSLVGPGSEPVPATACDGAGVAGSEWAPTRSVRIGIAIHTRHDVCSTVDSCLVAIGYRGRHRAASSCRPSGGCRNALTWDGVRCRAWQSEGLQGPESRRCAGLHRWRMACMAPQALPRVQPSVRTCLNRYRPKLLPRVFNPRLATAFVGRRRQYSSGVSPRKGS